MKNECVWLLIKYLPEEYFWQEFDNLIVGNRNYYHICYRFAVNPDFVVDREKLSPYDYVRILLNNNRDITDKEALASLLKHLKLKMHKMFNFLDYKDKHNAIVTFVNWNDHITQRLEKSKLCSETMRKLNYYQKLVFIR